MAMCFSFRVSGFRNGFVFRVNRQILQRVTEIAPGIQSALERPDAFHAFVPEEERHTGAGSFVWSSAVKNNFPVARQPVILFLEFSCVQAKSAGHAFPL